jgi:hypothetical protein
MNPIFWRVIADVLIFLVVMMLPWWLILIFCLIALFCFDFYLEIVLVGFIIDCLYSPGGFLGRFIFTLSFGVLLFLSLYLKKYLKFY